MSNEYFFFSCSFDARDDRVNALIRAVCGGMGLDLANVSAASPRVPPAEARKLISSANGLIAVATRRDRMADGTYKMPDAVRDEIAIAYGQSKPLLIVIEDRVSKSGFVSNYATYLSFSRGELGDHGFLQRAIASVDTFRRFAEQRRTGAGLPLDGRCQPTQLHHVSLPIRQLRRSVDFYENVVGLDPITRPKFLRFGGAWFQLPSEQQLHLLVNRLGNFRKWRTKPLDRQIDFRDCHFALKVDNAEEAYRRLQSRGQHINGNWILWNTRYHACYIKDPDGHIIEVTEGKLRDHEAELTALL